VGGAAVVAVVVTRRRRARIVRMRRTTRDEREQHELPHVARLRASGTPRRAHALTGVDRDRSLARNTRGITAVQRAQVRARIVQLTNMPTAFLPRALT